MAKAEWLTLSENTGSGNATISVTANEHTGREARYTKLTFTPKEADTVERVVMQNGKPEFITLNSETITISKDGTQVLSIEGQSNSKKLTFRNLSGDFDLFEPPTYRVNGALIGNGESLENMGDPGKTAQYNFQYMTGPVPSNTTTNELSKEIEITSEGGINKRCKVIVSAADPFFNVPTESIIIESSGQRVYIDIESNTSWHIN